MNIGLVPWKLVGLVITSLGCLVYRRQKNKLSQRVMNLSEELQAEKIRGEILQQRVDFAEGQIAKVLGNNPPKTFPESLG